MVKEIISPNREGTILRSIDSDGSNDPGQLFDKASVRHYWDQLRQHPRSAAALFGTTALLFAGAIVFNDGTKEAKQANSQESSQEYNGSGER